MKTPSVSKKTLFLVGLVAVATVVGLHNAASALADTLSVDTTTLKPTITIPTTEWIKAAGEFITPLLAALVGVLFRNLPESVVAILKSVRVDQLLEKAIQYGVNSVANANPDGKITFEVGNEVVANAANYFIQHGPGWILGWIGGPELLRQKIIARLNVAPEVALK
jgi:hypothetical protein